MFKLFFSVIFTTLIGFAGAAVAQQNVWIQIEAKRNLSAAQTSAREYSRALQDVNGFVMSSGWYAIAIGPYARPDADAELGRLRASGQIPFDSYVSFSNGYRRQFWPVGASALTAAPISPSIDLILTPVETPVVQPVIASEETRQQARQSERALTREDRKLLQTAMKWDGFYTAAIDGAFGPGTRNAMADWQGANGFDPTGVLTSKQRAQLVVGYQKVLSSIGMTRVSDNTAGIEIDLPLAMVEFDRYEPPFVHYKSKADSSVQLLLISQTGDDATLRGLFDIMQTLEIVPLEGERRIKKNSFTLAGENNEISSHSFAQLSNGHLKGFTLIWPAGQDRRKGVVLDAMRASFRASGDAVLPDVYGDPNAAQAVDLLAGLSIRRPDLSRSGFYVNETGNVLTTLDAVAQCGRITLDDTFDAELVATDVASGLALLSPSQPLTPLSYARFLPGEPRLNTEVSVSGYSYEGVLGAPTLTYGTLSDVKGLNGEPRLKRLALAPTAGDAGGPVFDFSGSVMGMLLPPDHSSRRLPGGVSFATDTIGIVEFLSANGLSAAASESTTPMAPEDLTIEAANMTVLVSCWN